MEIQGLSPRRDQAAGFDTCALPPHPLGHFLSRELELACSIQPSQNTKSLFVSGRLAARASSAAAPAIHAAKQLHEHSADQVLALPRAARPYKAAVLTISQGGITKHVLQRAWPGGAWPEGQKLQC